MVRKARYEAVRAKRGALDGTFMAHLDHNMGFGPTCGSVLPPLDTHPNISAWGSGRLLLGKECLGSQGIDIYPELAGKRPVSPLAALFDSLTDAEQGFLAGNSMHIPTLAAWMLYVLGHIAWRSDYSQMAPRVAQHPPELEDVDEEEDVE